MYQQEEDYILTLLIGPQCAVLRFVPFMLSFFTAYFRYPAILVISLLGREVSNLSPFPYHRQLAKTVCATYVATRVRR